MACHSDSSDNHRQSMAKRRRVQRMLSALSTWFFGNHETGSSFFCFLQMSERLLLSVFHSLLCCTVLYCKPCGRSLVPCMRISRRFRVLLSSTQQRRVQSSAGCHFFDLKSCCSCAKGSSAAPLFGEIIITALHNCPWAWTCLDAYYELCVWTRVWLNQNFVQNLWTKAKRSDPVSN